MSNKCKNKPATYTDNKLNANILLVNCSSSFPSTIRGFIWYDVDVVADKIAGKAKTIIARNNVELWIDILDLLHN